MAIEDSQPRPHLSRKRILEAAVQVMDEEGIEAVTMRRLGRELGVEAMSLYNHVDDKQAILEGICEAVMADYEFSEPSGDWVDDARAGARAWRRLLKAHPNVIPLFHDRRKPMTSVDALKPMEGAFEILRRAGLSEQDAVHAFRAFGGFIMGFMLMETGNVYAVAGFDTSDPQQITQVLPADRLPRIVELMPYLSSGDADEDFEFGLDLLLAGLRAKRG